MAINYMDYLRPQNDPLQSVLSGYNAAQAERQRREQQVLMTAQAERQRQMQEELAGFAENPNITPQDYASMIGRYPEMADQFKSAFDVLNEEQKANQRQRTLNLYALLDSNQTEFAKSFLQEQINADRNAGLEDDAKEGELMLQLVNTSPDAARFSAGLLLSSAMGPDEFAATWEKLREQGRADRLLQGELAKQAADLGLTKARTGEVIGRTKKLSGETQKLALEMEAMKSGTRPEDTAKRFDMEKKLRDDFNKRSSNLTESTRNFDVIRSSAASSSGPGDVALITAFMKMLDPGSVVRETEFATARDTGGLLTNLENLLQKAQQGDFLQPNQRNEFVRLAGQYLNAAQKEQNKVKRDLGVVVKNYDLNEQNVFGLPPEEEEAPSTPAMGADDLLKKFGG